jgi:hypothetical protein
MILGVPLFVSIQRYEGSLNFFFSSFYSKPQLESSCGWQNYIFTAEVENILN